MAPKLTRHMTLDHMHARRGALPADDTCSASAVGAMLVSPNLEEARR